MSEKRSIPAGICVARGGVPIRDEMRMGSPVRRGLTLVELMLALAVTAMIAGAIAGMMAAVSSGVGARRDGRTIMLRASAAQNRISSYVMPSRAIIGRGDDHLVLWFDDWRESGTIHASEIRWLIYDPLARAIDVFYVSFPSEWSQSRTAEENEEYTSDSNWLLVLRDLEMAGVVNSIRLIDGLSDCVIVTDDLPPVARLASFTLEFPGTDAPEVVRITSTIRLSQTPDA